MKQRLLPPALALGVALAGCAPSIGPNPYPTVPPLLDEAIPKPPVNAEALMWQPGHWDWNGSGYVWARGQYVPAAGHGNLWMPGWWVQSPSGWQWEPPHWMS